MSEPHPLIGQQLHRPSHREQHSAAQRPEPPKHTIDADDPRLPDPMPLDEMLQYIQHRTGMVFNADDPYIIGLLGNDILYRKHLELQAKAYETLDEHRNTVLALIQYELTQLHTTLPTLVQSTIQETTRSSATPYTRSIAIAIAIGMASTGFMGFLYHYITTT